MSKKLDASLKKIDKVFEECFRKGISPKESKRWSERTKTTYSNMVKGLAREAYGRFGVADFSKIKEEQVNELIQERVKSFHEGNLSEAYNIKTLVAAIKGFNHGVANTNKVYKKPFTVGNPDKIRKELKEQNVVRRSSASTTLRATPKECESVLENIKSGGYQTESREMAYHVAKLQLETGGRITSVLKLKKGDFSVSGNEVTFYQDKGGLTRSVAVSDETVAYLENLAAEKKDGERIFSSKRRDKSFKSVEETRKELSKIIGSASAHLTKTVEVPTKDQDGKRKMVTVTQKFSSHSFRKGFAMGRVKEYHDKFSSRSALNKQVAAWCAESPKNKEKLDNLRDRMNEGRNTKRDLNAREYAIFFTSVDLGHFRNDVITAYYTTFEEVEEYFGKEKK